MTRTSGRGPAVPRPPAYLVRHQMRVLGTSRPELPFSLDDALEQRLALTERYSTEWEQSCTRHATVASATSRLQSRPNDEDGAYIRGGSKIVARSPREAA